MYLEWTSQPLELPGWKMKIITLLASTSQDCCEAHRGSLCERCFESWEILYEGWILRWHRLWVSLCRKVSLWVGEWVQRTLFSAWWFPLEGSTANSPPQPHWDLETQPSVVRLLETFICMAPVDHQGSWLSTKHVSTPTFKKINMSSFKKTSMWNLLAYPNFVCRWLYNDKFG